MKETERGRILKSEHGKRMIREVSPIYDESYVMCWIYEAIGREIDLLQGYIDAILQEVIPSQANLLIDYWEQEYGIVPSAGMTLEQRITQLIGRIMQHSPFTPYRIKRFVETLTGRKCEVNERIAPYTFEIVIEERSDGTSGTQVVLDEIFDFIDRLRPILHDYRIMNQWTSRIKIKTSTKAYVYYYKATCGTLPYTNIIGVPVKGKIKIITHGEGHQSSQLHSGVHITGTRPTTSIIGGIGNGEIVVHTDGKDYLMPLKMPGTAEAGVIPDISIIGINEEGNVIIRAGDEEYIFPLQMPGTDNAGTVPAVSTVGVANTENVSVTGAGEGVMTVSEMSGTTPDISVVGAVDSRGITAKAEGTGFITTHEPSGILPDVNVISAIRSSVVSAQTKGEGIVTDPEITGVIPVISIVSSDEESGVSAQVKGEGYVIISRLSGNNLCGGGGL